MIIFYYDIFRNGMNRKERRAARVFCKIFESASQGDKRETPPQPLTPRKTYTFPKGTTFSLDEGLLMEFLEKEEVKRREITKEVATLTINDKAHNFSFFDFSMAIVRITDEMRKSMANDPDRARLEVVVMMYTQRFPYEESEGDLYPPSNS